MSNFRQIIDSYRNHSDSEQDKGRKFERLMRAYLQHSPKYRSITQVWLWSDFPYRKDFGGNDIGIDLVAKTECGDYWAIQCKCYAESAYISKGDVDSFISTAGKSFRDDGLQLCKFSHGIFFYTSNNLSSNVYEAFSGQAIAYELVGPDSLEKAPVDWAELDSGESIVGRMTQKRELREDQKTALEKVHEGFLTHDRGKMIMACGTGKTFTSLRIAEKECAAGGTVAFFVPSIALLGQALEAWCTFAERPVHPMCVCSDNEVATRKTKKKNDEDDSFTGETVELADEVTTDPAVIANHWEKLHKSAQQDGGMTVIFSTYQSIERLGAAQKLLAPLDADAAAIDLIVCDEAHRTTGVSLRAENDVVRGKKKLAAGEYDESAFVRVHNNDFIAAKKRLYMTATPRIYKLSDEIKQQQKESDAYLCSMDDETLFGPEFYKLSFGEAVNKGLLTDYKVLVLTVNPKEMEKPLQDALKSDKDNTINADDLSRFVGCINALSKRTLEPDDPLLAEDKALMHTAVAFCPSIALSKQHTDVLNRCKDIFNASLPEAERAQVVTVSADHVDGTMGAAERDRKLTWLAEAPKEGNECRILTNVRCLSEGVDVPSLDAVIFLSSRKSRGDIVQSVGRVMRRAPGKRYGYLIVPVVIPDGQSPEEALEHSDAFAIVWDVLKALRAHDNRFDAEINHIDLNDIKSMRIKLLPGAKEPKGGGAGKGDSTVTGGATAGPGGKTEFEKNATKEKIAGDLMSAFTKLKNTFYAQIVKHVGTRKYWELLASDMKEVVESHIANIRRLVTTDESNHQLAFNEFLSTLHHDLNPSVSADDAIEMLAQHLLTRPIFDALFDNYSFAASNAVSKALESLLTLLHDEVAPEEKEKMEKFYNSIRERVSGIDNAEGRQRVIVEIYDKFFKAAFPTTVEKLGIVYTPVEIVDFIIHSVAGVLEREFHRSLSDENVHILDPFTGTGTFITRLLQSRLIKPEALRRKYMRELHANEIVLLAYYIASVNIENVWHDVAHETTSFTPFDGICLTDTFQSTEDDGKFEDETEGRIHPAAGLVTNSDRVRRQKNTPIQVIIGNPPYSVGQKSANDNAQNQEYKHLEAQIATKYAQGSKAVNKKGLYDAYIKAFRWASDRIGDGKNGVICYVSNAGWLDGNAMDGFRKCLEEEFSAIYVFNLRGNQRTSGELSRREGGKIFGSGSRTPIAITMLVKRADKPEKSKGVIHYRDIGDYLTREEKLRLVAKYGSFFNPALELTTITPNEHYDWLNQRNDLFSTYIPIEPEKKYDTTAKSAFVVYSNGVTSNRDAWVYNFSQQCISDKMRAMVDFYNSQIGKSEYDTDPTKISWCSSLISYWTRKMTATFEPNKIVNALYRPFCRQKLYWGEKMIHRRGQWDDFFPTPQTKNLVICVSGIGVTKEFSCIITDYLPDLELIGKSQCFPMYYYRQDDASNGAFLPGFAQDSYKRYDGVSDFILKRCHSQYADRDITKEDIFYYVYGLLHSSQYRETFSADLKKMLPRIPLVERIGDFRAFAAIGRQLADLHLHYETQQPPSSVVVTGEDAGSYIVDKMRFADKADKSVIVYNSHITVSGIPAEAYEYVVNGKSAIEWLMERYQYKTDKDSQITNDPNAWCKEHNDPRYILTLLLSIITVSVETVRLQRQLPKLTVTEDNGN